MSTPNDRHGGEVLHRIGFVARYWRAAAYDRPEDRGPVEWAKVALVPALLVLPLALANAGAYAVIDAYPGYIPGPETMIGGFLGILPTAVEGLNAFLLALTMMYLGKLVILTAEDAYGEVSA